jgi:hypothetical protein
LFLVKFFHFEVKIGIKKKKKIEIKKIIKCRLLGFIWFSKVISDTFKKKKTKNIKLCVQRKTDLVFPFIFYDIQENRKEK